MQKNGHKRSLLSAILLVGGTCIGGGMLALPIASGINGFFPSLVIMGLCWLMMTLTALFLLEASLWFEEGAHVITITSRILGKFGVSISTILYLFICYASLVAYTSAAGIQMASALSTLLGVQISKEIGGGLFLVIFGSVIYIGSWFVGRVNTILFTAMVVAYFCLVGMGLDEVKGTLLMYQKWSSAYVAIPLLLTAFSFQTMVPSLVPYLKREAKSLRIAIVGGTAVAFFIYALWQWVILGIVPVEGSDGLAAALAKGDQPVTEFLRVHVHGYWIALIAEYFAFFAIVTSFLGITLGLYDFLADGLKVKQEKWGAAGLGALIAIPTYLIAVYLERAFMLAMEISGGVGDSILNGIIPALLLWRGRYVLKYPATFWLPGGKVALAIIIAFFTGALIIELLGIVGFIPSVYEGINIVEVTNLNS